MARSPVFGRGTLVFRGRVVWRLLGAGAEGGGGGGGGEGAGSGRPFGPRVPPLPGRVAGPAGGPVAPKAGGGPRGGARKGGQKRGFVFGVLAQESGPIKAVFGSFENTTLWVILGISLVALVFAYYLVREVLAAPEGTEKMKEIATAIQEGAKAYLSRQFRTLGIFLAILTVALFFVLPAPANAVHSEFSIKFGRSLAFILGAVFSATTGYVGMWLAVRANVRTANAARESGLRKAMRIAFPRRRRGRDVHGGAGPVGRHGDPDRSTSRTPPACWSASGSAARCWRCSCGSAAASSRRRPTSAPTWSARSSRASPRTTRATPPTIADNVGDNVGDCAGMAADLFESYEVTLVASLILGAAAYSGSTIGAIAGVMFPLFVRAVGVVTSIVGILAVSPRSEEEHGMKAINRGFFLSAVISAAAVFVISKQYMHSYRPGLAVCIGLVLASVIQVLTQYFTDTKHKPVQEIAEATVTGPATTILAGFSIGLESTVWSVLVIAGAIIAAFFLADPNSTNILAERLYFIALTGMGMLTTVGVIVSMDTFGPDLGQRAGHRRDVRRVRGAAGRDPGRPRRHRQLHEGDHEGHGDRHGGHRRDLAVRLLRGGVEGRRLRFFQGIRIDHPDVLVGLLLGGSVAFLFSSLAIRAVGRAAQQVVVEVRNQFRDHPGIMDYTEKPDYSRVVDICTKTSLRELTTPGLLAVLSPIIAGFFLKAEALGRLPRRRDPHRAAARGDAVELRRRVGQREEVHRRGQLRRQGQRQPQGRRHRRHGGRPVQGHGRTGA